MIATDVPIRHYQRSSNEKSKKFRVGNKILLHVKTYQTIIKKAISVMPKGNDGCKILPELVLL